MGGEARLVAVAREELALAVGLTADPVFATTQLWSGGLHQYNVGHVERLGRIETALASHPSLKLAGAGFYGIGLNECVRSGRNAADAVLLRLKDPASPRSTVLIDSGGAD